MSRGAIVKTSILVVGGVMVVVGVAYYFRTRRGSVEVGDIITGEDAQPTDAPTESLLETFSMTLQNAATTVSNAVTSRGYRNNNPGNIRYLKSHAWRGQVADDNGYGIYDTMQNGTRALGKQLIAYQSRGLDTVRKIISTWAPSTENNTQAYISDVAAKLGIDPDQHFDVVGRLPELAKAIARHENGYLASGLDFTWVYLP
jgi:hypothetical protein